jgi:hypothetical protein
VDILPEIVLRSDPLVFHFPISQHLDQDTHNLGSVELIPRHSSSVIAQVVEDPEVPWREDELDAIFDRLCFTGSGCIYR